MKNPRTLCLSILALLATSALAADDFASKPPTKATLTAQAKARAEMPIEDGQDADFVHRGFIATVKDPVNRAPDGHVIWDADRFAWVKGEAPPTVNPSLWRHTALLKEHGLFKVADNVWQVRNVDASNMTIVGGNTGWIIIDPLMTAETASVALALLNEHVGKRPVSGVIYTHSHPDHFGGVRGVVDTANLPPIIAPAKIIEEAVAENLIAGTAMGRRQTYQFGVGLNPSPTERVGGGIVIDAAKAAVTLINPTDYINKTGEQRVIDGVTLEFQMVPETEAPSEMNIFIPGSRTMFISEIATCTMHNVQTPRGALVRDTLKWAGYLTEILDRYGNNSDALVTGHCWPRFGNAAVKKYIGLQRDNYKFIHDQTVRLMNMGETPLEIAEQLTLPKAISDQWSNHGYYGTVKHNAKGVFQRYIGWWDGIPAHLNLYPPVEQGKRYVNAMGGASGVMKTANAAFASGDYRWSAEALNHLVFADPANKKAKALLADSYEQMGYQAESAVWRNIYLMGAAELRGRATVRMIMSSPDFVAAMPTGSLLDMLATRLNPETIGTRSMTMNIEVTDRHDGRALVSINNAVWVSEMGKANANPTVSIKGTQLQVSKLFLMKLPLDKVETDGLQVSGDREALQALQAAIETPTGDYHIVTP